MPVNLNPADIASAFKFTGVVVESVERVYDGKEIWSLTIYNETTDDMRKAESCNVVEPSSRGYVASALNKRLTAWEKAGVKPPNSDVGVKGYEGYRMEFEIVSSDYNFNGNSGTSVKAKPVKRIGRIEEAELAALKEKLAALRAGNAANRDTDSTPAAAKLPDWSSTEQDTLIDLYSGRTEEEVQAEAFNRSLDPKLSNAVATGSAAQWLIGHGLVDVDEQGRYVKVAV